MITPYPEFLGTLTGTNPVEDARTVRNYVDSSTYMTYGLNMSSVFRSLLIQSSSGSAFSTLNRPSKEGPFFASFYTIEDREICARLVGLWVLHRNEDEAKGLSFNSSNKEEQRYIYDFAMALLIPELLLRSELKNARALHDVATLFGVTADVLYRRMYGLGLL